VELLGALERPAFGIAPAHPLKIILVQAENDDGEIAEARDGISAGMQLTVEEKDIVGSNIKVVHEDTLAGTKFFEMLDAVLVEHPVDLIIIDPALAYLDGDTSSQRDVSQFLRRGLNPLLRRHECGALVVHHTNKPSQDKQKNGWQAGDYAYAGSGSAEWANWARAVIMLGSKGDHRRFDLVLGKRGNRAGWKNRDEGARFMAHLEHSKLEGQIHWRELTDEEYEQADKTDKPAPKQLLQWVPEGRSISKGALVSKAQQAGIGIQKTKGFIAQLVQNGELHEWEIPRKGTRPEIHLARYPQPPTGYE
jgi:hypothetical protein